MRSILSVHALLCALVPCAVGCKSDNNEQEDAGSQSCEYSGRVYADQTELCGFGGCNSCYCNPEPGVGIGCTLIGCLPASGTDQAESKGVCARTMWHLPDAMSPTTLALFDDGSFRWLAIDCNASSRGLGVWKETDGTITLSPAPGRTDFEWPGGTSHTELSVTRVGENLSAELEPSQTWQTGGRCPVCESADAGTQDAGAKREEPCANPFAYCNDRTLECAVRP